MNTILLPIASLLIAIFLNIVFFRKKNIHNKETNVYSVMLIFNLIYSILCILIYILAKTVGCEWLVGFLQKIYLIVMLIIIVCVLIYNINVLRFKEDTKWVLIKLSLVSLIVVSALILFTPINVINYGDVLDGNGISYNIAIGATIIYFVLVMVSSLLIITDKRNNFKSVPFLVLIGFYIIGLLVRSYFPSILFETFFFSFMMLIMYHTIENPDLKMLNEVNLAKNQAIKSNRVKSEFLSSMSHEIRTPLNAIVGFSQLIDSAKTLKEAKENAREIVNASNTLLIMLTNVLDISQVEVDSLEIVEVKYDIRDMVCSICDLFKYKLDEKHLELDLDITNVPSILVGDVDKIKRIIANLLDNAIKYTEVGHISLTVTGKVNNNICKLEIIVQDTGQGMSKETKENLFSNFLREEKDNSKSGMGLGLSITKSLVELLKGKITVTSTLGEGTTFKVILSQKVGKKK